MDGRQRTSGRRCPEEIIRQANNIKPRTAGLFILSVISGLQSCSDSFFITVMFGLDPDISFMDSPVKPGNDRQEKKHGNDDIIFSFCMDSFFILSLPGLARQSNHRSFYCVFSSFSPF